MEFLRKYSKEKYEIITEFYTNLVKIFADVQ